MSNALPAAPAFEYADDHSAWVRERADHEARVRFAGSFVRSLVTISGAMPVAQQLPTRESHEAHLEQVERFASKARRSVQANPAWVPSPMFLSWVELAGCTLGEVLSAAHGDEIECVCAWCGEDAPALHEHEGDHVCGACLTRDEVERDASHERACACGTGGLCRECTGVSRG